MVYLKMPDGKEYDTHTDEFGTTWVWLNQLNCHYNINGIKWEERRRKENEGAEYVRYAGGSYEGLKRIGYIK